MVSIVQKKIDNFSQKFFLKVIMKQKEKNISLNPKKNLLDTLHGKTLKAKQ